MKAMVSLLESQSSPPLAVQRRLQSRPSLQPCGIMEQLFPVRHSSSGSPHPPSLGCGPGGGLHALEEGLPLGRLFGGFSSFCIGKCSWHGALLRSGRQHCLQDPSVVQSWGSVISVSRPHPGVL